jgi:hypothetical protein
MSKDQHIAEFRTVLTAKSKKELLDSIKKCWDKFDPDVNIYVVEIFGEHRIKWQKAFMQCLHQLYQREEINDIVFLQGGTGFKKMEVPWH